MRSDDLDAHLAGLAAFAEPIRRDLYRYVVAQPEPVSREQVAQAVGVAHHVAKFHLDKLESEGLLDVEYRRPEGRTGPGAGRTAKFYRRSSRQLEVSLPARRYELAGRLLARAVTDSARQHKPVADALREAAVETGQSLGAEVRRVAGRRPRREALLAAALEVLVDQGYEPRADDDGVTLANCPFHALAQEYTDLVCGMNLALMQGVVEGAGLAGLEPCLEPEDGRCCVRLVRQGGPA
jgi:predicted ArsR family transcriptional regulator